MEEGEETGEVVGENEGGERIAVAGLRARTGALKAETLLEFESS